MRVGNQTSTARGKARHGRPAAEHQARMAERFRRGDSTTGGEARPFASADDGAARREDGLRRFLHLTRR